MKQPTVTYGRTKHPADSDPERVSHVAFYKKRDPLMYQQTLTHLIEETKKGKMFGEWNDCGRLLYY